MSDILANLPLSPVVMLAFIVGLALMMAVTLLFTTDES